MGPSFSIKMKNLTLIYNLMFMQGKLKSSKHAFCGGAAYKNKNLMISSLK